MIGYYAYAHPSLYRSRPVRASRAASTPTPRRETTDRFEGRGAAGHPSALSGNDSLVRSIPFPNAGDVRPQWDRLVGKSLMAWWPLDGEFKDLKIAWSTVKSLVQNDSGVGRLFLLGTDKDIAAAIEGNWESAPQSLKNYLGKKSQRTAWTKLMLQAVSEVLGDQATRRERVQKIWVDTKNNTLSVFSGESSAVVLLRGCLQESFSEGESFRSEKARLRAMELLLLAPNHTPEILEQMEMLTHGMIRSAVATSQLAVEGDSIAKKAVLQELYSLTALGGKVVGEIEKRRTPHHLFALQDAHKRLEGEENERCSQALVAVEGMESVIDTDTTDSQKWHLLDMLEAFVEIVKMEWDGCSEAMQVFIAHLEGVTRRRRVDHNVLVGKNGTSEDQAVRPLVGAWKKMTEELACNDAERSAMAAALKEFVSRANTRTPELSLDRLGQRVGELKAVSEIGPENAARVDECLRVVRRAAASYCLKAYNDEAVKYGELVVVGVSQIDSPVAARLWKADYPAGFSAASFSERWRKPTQRISTLLKRGSLTALEIKACEETLHGIIQESKSLGGKEPVPLRRLRLRCWSLKDRIGTLSHTGEARQDTWDLRRVRARQASRLCAATAVMKTNGVSHLEIISSKEDHLGGLVLSINRRIRQGTKEIRLPSPFASGSNDEATRLNKLVQSAVDATGTNRLKGIRKDPARYVKLFGELKKALEY